MNILCYRLRKEPMPLVSRMETFTGVSSLIVMSQSKTLRLMRQI